MVQFERKSKYEKKNKKVSRSVRKKIILNLVRENFREFYFSKKKMSLKKKEREGILKIEFQRKGIFKINKLLCKKDV